MLQLQSLSSFSALARLYYLARPTKTAMLRRLPKVTFHIITSLGVVFSLSTLISKLSRVKIIGSFKLLI